MLGSVIPSSRFLVNRLLKEIDWSRAKVIVEYGPGVGVFTAEILRRMGPDAALIAFELNDDLVDFLRRSIGDPRLHIVHGSAADVRTVLEGLGHSNADYIVSGIPYTTMPASVRDTILQESRAMLATGGMFLVYQFSRASLPFVRQVFSDVRVEREMLNVPPATTYVCRVGDGDRHA
jgi:phospholipid N-methyltransferase